MATGLFKLASQLCLARYSASNHRWLIPKGRMVVSEYSVILIALVFDMCLGARSLGISLAIAQSQGVCLNYSKVSSFECGFLNFSDARQKFNINFYLVGILFVIFDIEVTVKFPWALLAKETPAHYFWVVYLFILILALGFLLEWLKGAFEWKLINLTILANTK